ncbi:MAG: BBP7 family outer membrane beta-barrel protein [Fimbriiglobus sp.]
MKKFFLGAGAALALLSMPASAQSPSQKPAPIVPASDVVSADMPATTADPGLQQTGAFNILNGIPGVVGGSGGGSPARMYTEASYLLMFVSDANAAGPLLTGGTAQGVLGRPGTSVLSNGESSYGVLNGFKVGVGGLVGATSLGFEANTMVFGNVSDRQTFGPTSATLLARPINNTAGRTESAIAIAAPTAFIGGYDETISLSAWGFEANPFFRLVQGNSVNFDFITGFRYFNVNEKLDIYDSRTVLPGGATAFNGIGLGSGAQLVVHDKFSARNQFYGWNVGGRLSYANGPLFVDLTAKVAIGGVRQLVNVDGTTTLVSGGGLVGPSTTPGGLLANPSFTGERAENRFAVLPEGNLQVGYQLSSWMNVFAGYQVMYMSSMARATEQVSRDMNPSSIPTLNTYNARAIRPAMVEVKEADLFLHGFNFGFTITY